MANLRRNRGNESLIERGGNMASKYLDCNNWLNNRYCIVWFTGHACKVFPRIEAPPPRDCCRFTTHLRGLFITALNPGTPRIVSRDIRRINTYTAYKFAGQKDFCAHFYRRRSLYESASPSFNSKLPRDPYLSANQNLRSPRIISNIWLHKRKPSSRVDCWKKINEDWKRQKDETRHQRILGG